MEFWHIYRLIFAKRWLLLLLVATTGAILFLATMFQANHTETLTEAKLGIDRNMVATGPTATQPDPNSSINDVVNTMTRNSQVINDTARLLKLDEKARAREFLHVLEQTGHFATADADARDAVEKRIAAREIAPNRRKSELSSAKTKLRSEAVRQYAEARDKSGAYAQNGVPESPEAIIETIRKEIKVEPISSLDSTDNNIKFTNSVRITGKLPREAQANLYVNTFCLAFMDYYRRVTNNSSNKTIESLETALTGFEQALRAAHQEESRIKRNPDVSGPESVQSATFAAEQSVQKLHEAYDGSIASMNSLTDDLKNTRQLSVLELPAGEKASVQSLEAEVTRSLAAYKKAEANSNADIGNTSDTTVSSAKQEYETTLKLQPDHKDAKEALKKLS